MCAANPLPEQRRIHLVRSGTFTGWLCSGCAWKWPIAEYTSESDRNSALDLMRHTFATHRCEDYPGDPPVLPAGSRLALRRIAHLIQQGARLARLDRIPLLKVEEAVAAMIAVASMLWTVQLVTVHFASIARVAPLPPEPVGICAIAVLVWLHAKWRAIMKDGPEFSPAESAAQ
jgi:hypothetical protein